MTRFYCFNKPIFNRFLFIVLFGVSVFKVQASDELSFYQAIFLAQKFDPWLKGNLHKQDAIQSLSQAANHLPDPQISLGVANIGADRFDFNQEQMTQLKVGITQMFSRGNSLAIKSQQLNVQSEAFPYQRQNRQAQVAVTVGTIWFEIYKVEHAITLLLESKKLYEQLSALTQADYAAGTHVNKVSQHDLLKAELEVIKIEDKLARLGQEKHHLLGQLQPWLFHSQVVSTPIFISHQLPKIELSHAILNNNNEMNHQLMSLFMKHPAVLAIDKSIDASQLFTALAKQKYQPEWGVTASYGYRDDNANGDPRADLFSIGVIFDLPLFTANKQDKELSATVSQTQAIKTEKQLLLRQYLGIYLSTKGRYVELLKRIEFFQDKFLPKIQQQIDFTLSAYGNGNGRFSEVVNTKIAYLDAQITLHHLLTDQQKLHLELNYLFVTASKPIGQFQLNTGYKD
jgi:outer membrane protein TolC